MMGIVLLAPESAATAGVVLATITSGCCSTTSFARLERSISLVTQR
jgi:hypothetical protein